VQDFESAKANKAVVRREVQEIFNQGNLDATREVYAPDYIAHGVLGASEDIRGVEGARKFAASIRKSFPDLELTIEDEIAEGDKVVTRLTMRGTHQGEFMGVAPTGKSVEVSANAITRVEGGKIVEY
jgi:steroid delta-isomerase-like uncharacterized protein